MSLVKSTLYILLMISYLNLAGSERDIECFSKMHYEGVFFSMYDISCYREEDFVTFRGVLTVKAQQPVKNWSSLSRYLDAVFSSENKVTNVFLGLDPAVLWKESYRSEEKWEKNMDQYLTSYIAAREDVKFDILLPAYQLSSWMKLGEKQLEETLYAYGKLVDRLCDYPNVAVFFLGGEQWLIANPDNYLAGGRTNEEVSRKILLFTFCDQEYRIVPVNSSILFERLVSQVEQEREAPTVYPDLSDLCVVFFGDSILTYKTGSMSIPGVVEGLSGAQVYNCGEGGLPASGNPADFYNLNGVIDHFMTQDISGEPNKNFWRGLTDYMEENHKGKKHCFILNVGLNDFFVGAPVESPKDAYDTETYAGALRTGIHSLQEAYPDALILVMAPTYVSSAMDINSEAGGTLEDYVDAAVRVAEEMGVYCMNNYHDSGIDAESQAYYLTDGIHPNETCCFHLGRQIIEYLGGILSEE